MKLKTVAQVTNDLNAIAKQHGKSGFDSAKAVYMKSVTVTNDDGDVLSPDQYNIEIEIADDAPNTKAATVTADDLQSVVKSAVDLAIANRGGVTITKASTISMADSRRDVPRGKAKHMKSAEMAHDFGRWITAAALGPERGRRATEYCRSKGLSLLFGDFKNADSDEFVTKAITGQSEAVNADGGFLVPHEFDPEIIWLRERYGVFRNNARIVTMTRETKSVNRKTGSHTAYHVGEGATNTVSKMTLDQLMLVAKKARIDGALTDELSEDAAVNLGDETMKDIIERFAYLEDLDGFTGDGTSTYGGIVGLSNAFLNLGTVSNSAGISDLTGTAWESITAAQLAQWMSKLPEYAETNAKFYCSKPFYHTVFERLMASGGGNSMVDLSTGLTMRQYLGYPVVISQAMPRTTTADTPECYFGDLSAAAFFGDRRGLTFRTSADTETAWTTDQTVYKASERFDINIHDIGNNNATAALRVAGPLIALIAT